MYCKESMFETLHIWTVCLLQYVCCLLYSIEMSVEEKANKPRAEKQSQQPIGQ